MKPKILVVDDDLPVLESIRKLLVSEGYDALAARDGIEAMEHFNSSPVDLVVLDLNLGSDNGWEVFKAMTELNPFVPTVIITAESGQMDRATAAGVEALVEKPLDVPTFLKIIRDLLAETREQRLKRVCGDEEYCHYVARRYETFLKLLQERCSAPMKLSAEFRAMLPVLLETDKADVAGTPSTVGDSLSGTK